MERDIGIEIGNAQCTVFHRNGFVRKTVWGDVLAFRYGYGKYKNWKEVNDLLEHNFSNVGNVNAKITDFRQCLRQNGCQQKRKPRRRNDGV